MSEELTPPRFPTMLRKMWSGGEVQAWIDENWNRRAQPAAPAAYLTDCPKSESAIDAERTKAREDMCLYGIGFTVNGWHVPAPLVSICKLPDAAPSVAPEPVAWTTLIEIDWVKRNAGRAGSFYAVKAGPNDIPLFAHPPRAPLTEEQKRDLVKECDLDWQRGFMPLFDGDPTNRYAVLIEAVEAAHGIGGN